MKLTRIEERCDHGFLKGAGLCPDCDGHRAIGRNESKVHGEIIVPGLVVGGATVITRRDDERVDMTCGCGRPFITTRNALLQVRHRKGRCCCAECRSAARRGNGAPSRPQEVA
jgi:hypothetical protein